MQFAERHPAYDHINAKESMGKRHGNQVGDPQKVMLPFTSRKVNLTNIVQGARAMYELAVMKDPPLRVVIGSDAYTVSHP